MKQLLSILSRNGGLLSVTDCNGLNTAERVDRTSDLSRDVYRLNLIDKSWLAELQVPPIPPKLTPTPPQFGLGTQGLTAAPIQLQVVVGIPNGGIVASI